MRKRVLDAFLAELIDCARQIPGTFEIILVDDGSRDGGAKIAVEWTKKDPAVRLIQLRRNFGQTAAVGCGIDHARGEIVVLLDADGQNDPHDIPLLLAEIEKGADIASGWRRKRRDTFLTRTLPSRIANTMISILTGVHLHDYGCSLKAYRREVVRDLDLVGEMHRFIPALASWHGARVTEVEVNHRARTKGVSKYGLGRIHKVFLDLLAVKFLIGYSTRPMRVFGVFGMLTGGIGVACGLTAAYGKIFWEWNLSNHAITILSVLFLLIGMQLLALGLMAELAVRTYYRAAGFKPYAIRRIVDSQKNN